MIIYKRILGFLTSIILVASVLMTHYFPEKIFIFIFISLFFCLFYFWSIKNRFVYYSTLSKYLLIVFFFLISVWLFFVVIDILWLKFVLSFLMLVYLIVIFDSIFKKIYLNQDINHPALIYIDLVCFWFIAYFLFYLIIIFRINLALVLIGLLLSILFSVLIRFYWYQINVKNNLIYLFSGVVILNQIFVFSSFLALNLYSLAFVLWTWYYILMDFLVDKIKEEFIWSQKKRFLFFFLLLFIFYLISVR